MSDLAGFLLARFAEDEAKIEGYAWVDKPPYGNTFDTVSDCDCGEDHGFSTYLAVDPARLLAECEAKRQIVKRFSDTAWLGGRAPRDVLFELLALPYADHPDYRQEWTP